VVNCLSASSWFMPAIIQPIEKTLYAHTLDAGATVTV
jgi:hypothetical protein